MLAEHGNTQLLLYMVVQTTQEWRKLLNISQISKIHGLITNVLLSLVVNPVATGGFGGWSPHKLKYETQN